MTQFEFGRPVGGPNKIVSNFLKPVKKVFKGAREKELCSRLI